MFGGDAKDIRQGEAMSSNPSATGKSFFTIDPRRCALIVIDMQNAFVAEGAVFETPGARAMIPRLEHLIQGSRHQNPDRLDPIRSPPSLRRTDAAQVPTDRGRPHSVARRAEF